MKIGIALLLWVLVVVAPFATRGARPKPLGVADLVVRGKFKKALDTIGATPDSESSRALKATLERLLSIDALVEEKFKADIGQRVVVPTDAGLRAGILREVKGGVLKIKIDKGNVTMVVPVKISELVVPFKVEKAELRNEEKNLILAVQCFNRGEYMAAEKLFAETGALADMLSAACHRGDGYATELMAACRNNDLEGFAKLLEEGANPNAKCAAVLFNPKTKKRTRIVTTVLVEVVKSGNAEMVKALVGKGAKVNQANSKGISPLMFAIWHFPDGDPIIDFFLDHKADPNHADREGNTPLSGAIALRKTKTAEKLLKRGANPNKPTRGGITPLMLAVMSNNLELAKKLIAGGADIHARAGKGWTVLDLNRSKLSPGMKALLEKYSPAKTKRSSGPPPVRVLTK